MEEKQQAFPAAWGNHEQGGDYVPGMTMRDYFAGQALAGISAINGPDFSLSPEDEAAWAYQRADAMLAARTQGDDQ